MLKALKNLFAGGGGSNDAGAPGSDAAAMHKAIAALMVEAARADEDYTEKERRLIEQALVAQFSLAPDAVGALVDDAEAAADGAIDLHQFTKRAKTLSDAEKISLIETLWRIVLSDETRDPYEDAFMRRLCGLLYVSDKESGEARQRVSQASEDN